MDRFPPPHPIYPPVIHYGPAPIPLRKEPHIPLTPKTGMRREEIERRIAEAGVTAEERASWNAKYAKPSTGIPKTDLASGVQASLDKADTALQEHQSLSGYATEEWVGEQGFLTEHQDITGKVDKSALFDNPDTNPMVKSALLPSYVDDVLEYASTSGFPSSGETGKIYVAKDTNKTYRWTGTQYVQVGGDEQAQADWAQTNSSSPDFIKNKPTIPPAITVDSAMSSSSTNPVQNKVVKAAIDGKISWDNSDKNSATIGNRQAYINHGTYSLVVGDNAAATGYQCVAIGYGVGTTGNNSAVIGWWSSAGANSALSVGQNTNAVARGSIVAGKRATASTGDWGTGTAHEYAFVWQGGGSVAPSNSPSVGGGYYHSHDEGTFNINPKPASGSTDPATGFWIGEKKLPEVIAQNTNYLAYASTTTLAPETAVYRSALNADGTFPTITATGIPTAAAYYQFELELTVPSTVPATIYGPTMGGTAFDSTASYAVGDYVVYDNVEYVCVTAHTGAWDASHFKQAWVFLDGHGLPDPADLVGGETICISIRLDCTARTFLASVWRVA